MSTIGLYQPGGSVLHRLPAGVKLGAMVLAGIGSIFLDTSAQVGVALLVVLVGYVVARSPWRVGLRLLKPVLWFSLPLGAFHVIVNGWERAAVVVGVIVVLVLLANLVTLTTRTTALVDVVVAICRPLRPLGVNAERVGLLLMLGIRAVPIVVELAEEVRDAQRARGLSASPRAFAVPLIVGALRRADALGDALAARGLDD
ncbi:energy-coupling factor transporter transmembrane component T family protein [Nocardioides pacificus]